MELTPYIKCELRFRDDNPKCTYNPPTKARDLNMEELNWATSQYKGRVPHADPLVWRRLAQLALLPGSVNTLVESDLLSYMVSGLETSLSQPRQSVGWGPCLSTKGPHLSTKGPFHSYPWAIMCMWPRSPHSWATRLPKCSFQILLIPVSSQEALALIRAGVSATLVLPKMQSKFLVCKTVSSLAISIIFFLFIPNGMVMVTFIGSSFMAS